MCIFSRNRDRPSPSDIFPPSSMDALVYFLNNSATLENLNIPFTKKPIAIAVAIADTKSMDELFDAEANAIVIYGADNENQQIMVDWMAEQWLTDPMKGGNIAIYSSAQAFAIHRVIKVGFDNEGRYFKFKGDNNSSEDPWKIRDSEIKYLTVLLAY